MVDESPSVKSLISKVLEDHRSSRTDPPLLLKNGSQFKKDLEAVSVFLKLTTLYLLCLSCGSLH